MDGISSEQGDEGDGEEAVPRDPGAEEIRPRVPHILSDLDMTIHSRPSDIEFNKAHSLSPKGMQQAHDIRVSEILVGFVVILQRARLTAVAWK